MNVERKQTLYVGGILWIIRCGKFLPSKTGCSRGVSPVVTLQGGPRLSVIITWLW